MKILYVSQYYPPEMGAPAARVSELSRHWVKLGHEVSVLTGFPNHPTGVVYPGYRGKLRHLVCNERKDGVRVVRTWLFPLPNRKSHERILNYSSFCLSSSLRGSFLSGHEVVIATSPQLLVGVTGWWLSKVKGIPFVLEIRDLWPESITASGVGNETSTLARFLSSLSGFLYRACDHLVVVTPAFKKDIISKYRISPEKISLVENGVEPNLFRPGSGSGGVKSELGISGKFVVSYIGTMGLAHGLTTMVEAATRLQRDYPDIQFILVGEGADKEALSEMARSRGLGNIRFLPKQPREKMPDIIRVSEVCLVLLKKAEVFKTVIPTKMLEFMACGRPVILGVDGQARQVMEEAEAGIFVEPEDPNALVRAVTQLYHNADLRRTLGRNGRDFIVKHLSRKKTAEQYISVLKEVTSKWKKKRD